MKALPTLEAEQSPTAALLMTLMGSQDREKLANLVECLDKASTAYSMESSASMSLSEQLNLSCLLMLVFVHLFIYLWTV